jgi:predicted dehydrogenase
MINIGLIGYGYWGPNLARNFSQNPDLTLTAICDTSPDRLKSVRRFYPRVAVCDSLDDFYKRPDIDAVAIATPVGTHYELARRAFESGRHVWLEKPMTDSVDLAERLIELASRKRKTLLVDHTFIYTGAVRKIRELIDRDQLGKLIYYDSTRVNLGLFQQDVNVLWDLAPHDLSIMDHLMPFAKLAVSATGSHYYGNGIVPKSLLTIYMEGDVVAHINVSWVSPVKIRQTLIGGTLRMVLYDDTEPSEKVKIYDKGVDLNVGREEMYRLKVQYRVGDMYAPKLEDHEALAVETAHFADCILHGREPLTDGRTGMEVVKVLVAGQESLRRKGAPVELVQSRAA